MIRKYRSEDLERVLEIWYNASQVAHPFLDEAFFDYEREQIRSNHVNTAEIWVYELNDIPIGFIALIGNEVGAIFLEPAFHGRGFGKALMDHAQSLHKTLELDVFKENKIGRSFYDRYGFKVIGEHVHPETGHVQLRMRFPG